MYYPITLLYRACRDIERVTRLRSAGRGVGFGLRLKRPKGHDQPAVATACFDGRSDLTKAEADTCCRDFATTTRIGKGNKAVTPRSGERNEGDAALLLGFLVDGR